MLRHTSPPARRLARPRWLDARVATGLLLVLVSVVVGARVFTSADHRDRVWAARHPLAAGQQVTAADLEPADARLYGHGDRYVSADRPPPSGYVLLRAVGAGELLPYDALGDAAAPDVRAVSVPVARGHLPADLARGDVVDVYATPKQAEGAPAASAELVVERVTVLSRDGDAHGFAPASAVVGVVLEVPAADVARLVAAGQSAAIDLVRVPRGAPAPASAQAASGP